MRVHVRYFVFCLFLFANSNTLDLVSVIMQGVVALPQVRRVWLDIQMGSAHQRDDLVNILKWMPRLTHLIILVYSLHPHPTIHPSYRPTALWWHIKWCWVVALHWYQSGEIPLPRQGEVRELHLDKRKSTQRLGFEEIQAESHLLSSLIYKGGGRRQSSSYPLWFTDLHAGP